jgi:hypothetical protein
MSYVYTCVRVWVCVYIYIFVGYAQKNGAVSKVNKKCISHLTLAQRTPSAAATVHVSRALQAVRFSCLLRGRGAQFPKRRRSRKRLNKTRDFPACSALPQTTAPPSYRM